MQDDSGRSQAIEFAIQSVVGLVPQQTCPKFGFGGVDRNIERRQTLFDDPVQFGVINVGEGQVVTKEKRKAIVLVFDAKRSASVGPVLVNETEHAFVVAHPGLDGLQFNPKTFPFFPHEFVGLPLGSAATQAHQKPPSGTEGR